jgi:uncharacterized membrane protein YhaH (DUF805 family)
MVPDPTKSQAGSPPDQELPNGSEADRLMWFGRARAMNTYEDAIKQADKKALDLFGLIQDQMRRQFWLSMAIHLLIITSAIIVLIISIVIVLSSTADAYQRSFSLVGIPISILALLVALLRNPIAQHQRLLDTTLKLNIVFLSFTRLIRQSDLMLQSQFYENGPLDLAKVYSLMQEFQNMVDQAMEEIDQINSA